MAILALPPDDEWNALLFVPMILTTDQCVAPLPSCPEKRLMLAVLDQAYEDWRKHKGLSDKVSRALSSDARRWFCSDDEEWPLSCARICAVLSIDLSALRVALFGH